MSPGEEPQSLVQASSSHMLALLMQARADHPDLPHRREIVLLECDVKGTTLLEDAETLEPCLEVGMNLVCKREAGNREDPMAIRIETHDGRQVGYVPRPYNEIIARLMEAGKIILARIASKAWLGSWLKVTVEIVMDDL